MRRFLKEQSGNALLWPLFIMLILMTLSVVAYSGITVYAKYQACENELQQAAIISADMNMENANVRDLMLDISPDSALSDFKANLQQSGWKTGDNSWMKYESGKKMYSLEGVRIEITDEVVQIAGNCNIPLPWEMGEETAVSIPMQVRASILYLDLEGG